MSDEKKPIMMKDKVNPLIIGEVEQEGVETHSCFPNRVPVYGLMSVKMTAEFARQQWRGHRDKLIEKYGFSYDRIYGEGVTEEDQKKMPRDLLMAVCYVDAFNSVLTWPRVREDANGCTKEES